jgi:hypothetical protein
MLLSVTFSGLILLPKRSIKLLVKYECDNIYDSQNGNRQRADDVIRILSIEFPMVTFNLI